MGEPPRDLAEQGGVPARDQATVLPPKIVEWAHGDRSDDGLQLEPGIEVFGGHDSIGLDSRREMGKLSERWEKLSAKLCHAIYQCVGRPAGSGTTAAAG